VAIDRPGRRRRTCIKGALFLNTLRSVVDDDPKWFALIHDLITEGSLPFTSLPQVLARRIRTSCSSAS